MAYEMQPGLSDPNKALLKGDPGLIGPAGFQGTPGDNGKNGNNYQGNPTPYDVPELKHDNVYDYQYGANGIKNGCNFYVSESIVSAGIFSAIFVNVFVSLALMSKGVTDEVFYTLKYPMMSSIDFQPVGETEFVKVNPNGDITYTCPAIAGKLDANRNGMKLQFDYFAHHEFINN